MLNIKDALKLYKLIGEFIPDNVDKDTRVLDFAGTIVDNISASDIPERFGESLLLMSKKSLEELESLDGTEILKLFTDGLIKNNVLELTNFCKSLSL